jgi:hypothetical protein
VTILLLKSTLLITPAPFGILALSTSSNNTQG